MDLIDRKRIKNGLPKYSNGFTMPGEHEENMQTGKDNISATADLLKNKINVANLAGAGIQGAVGMLADFNSYGYNKSVNDLNNQAGTNQETTNGITYTTQNFIGNDELRNAESEANGKILGSMGTGAAAGASIGSVIPGVGTAIGGAVGAVGGLISGIFGSKKAKREARRRIEEQRQRAAIQNDFARGVAATKGLNLDYLKEHGNTETQSLYKDGKTPVYSPFGPVNVEPDSKVSKGEVAIDTQTGSRYRIPTGPNDTALFAGGKNPNTAIITNKYGLSDIAMENPELAIQMQKELKEAGMLKKTKGEYKCGKTPKYLDGLTQRLNALERYNYTLGYDPLESANPFLNGGDPAPINNIPYIYMNTGEPAKGAQLTPEPVQPRIPKLPERIPYKPIWRPGSKLQDPNEIKDNNDAGRKNIADTLNRLGTWPTKSPSTKKGPLISLGGLKNIFGNADPNQVANAAIHAIGAGIGLDQYRRYKNEQAFKPDTFAHNQLQDEGLKLLASQDINAYPIMRKLDQQRAWTDYMLNNSGGLSGAQKYLGRIANSRNTQSSIADMLSNIGLQRNQLRANYANALLTTGAQEAQNRMAANKYDIDMFMRSHAARQQGMDTGIYNMLNNAQSYLANKFKYDQFLKTYGLYSTDLNNKRE